MTFIKRIKAWWLRRKEAKPCPLCKHPNIPNAQTIAAMKAAERGKVTTFESIDDLLCDLNNDGY